MGQLYYTDCVFLSSSNLCYLLILNPDFSTCILSKYLSLTDINHRKLLSYGGIAVLYSKLNSVFQLYYTYCIFLISKFSTCILYRYLSLTDISHRKLLSYGGNAVLYTKLILCGSAVLYLLHIPYCIKLALLTIRNIRYSIFLT